MKELRLQITDELHRHLKQTALDKSMTLKRLTTEALEEYFSRYKEEEKIRREERKSV